MTVNALELKSSDIAARKRHFAERSPLIRKLKDAIRVRGLALNTERAYLAWVVDFIFYHGQKHPGEMAEAEIRQYLTHLAAERTVSESTQNQALNAIVFLFSQVLCKSLGAFGEIPRAKRRQTLPECMAPEEVGKVLAALSAEMALPVKLLYGAGLRLHECVTLRLKDIDFALDRITVRDGKGGKDRLVPLPRSLKAALHAQVGLATAVHAQDERGGVSGVFLPDALARKYPGAAKSLAWFWLFPAKSLSLDPRGSGSARRRHHIHDATLQVAFKAAVKRAGITGRKITPHTLRHSFCTALLEANTPPHVVQAMMGHESIETTMRYTHLIPGRKMVSPLDFPAEKARF